MTHQSQAASGCTIRVARNGSALARRPEARQAPPVISRRSFLVSAMLPAIAPLARVTSAPAAVAETNRPRPSLRDVPPWSLYAFDNGLNGPDVPSLEAKAALLKRLGFSGMTDHFNLNRLESVVKQLDRHGLEITSVYHTPFIEDEPEPALADVLRLLAGRRTRIELGLRSRTFKSSDPAGDERGLHWLRHVAKLCGDSGPVVSVYPHKWFWTERLEDGLRLARKAADPRIGTNFNLIHWQITPPRRPVPDLFAEALPHLSLVTICGINRDQTSPEVLPLNQGDFDLAGCLVHLKKAGYQGPIGLQCYGIKGDSAPHLEASIQRWREIRPA
jgi:sugar phosphate isomerase/epimerase